MEVARRRRAGCGTGRDLDTDDVARGAGDRDPDAAAVGVPGGVRDELGDDSDAVVLQSL